MFILTSFIYYCLIVQLLQHKGAMIHHSIFTLQLTNSFITLMP